MDYRDKKTPPLWYGKVSFKCREQFKHLIVNYAQQGRFDMAVDYLHCIENFDLFK